MVRPRKIKIVNFEPNVTYFKPRAVPLVELEEVELTVDELETLRLANLEKLSQADAAARMKIHQSTFHRTLTRAREKLTDALVNGKAIKIRGGDYKTMKMKNFQGAKKQSFLSMSGGDGTGPIGLGAARGKISRSFRAGPGGFCVCPKCGYQQEHVRGQPCVQAKCAKCGTFMTRLN